MGNPDRPPAYLLDVIGSWSGVGHLRAGPSDLRFDTVDRSADRLFGSGGHVGFVAKCVDCFAHVVTGLFYFLPDCSRVFAHCTSSLRVSVVCSSTGGVALDTLLFATTTFSWVNCGHPPAYLVDIDQQLIELKSARHPALGRRGNDQTYRPDERQLNPRERLILLTDGITERKLENGANFGIDGIRRALEKADNDTAASTAMAIQQTLTDDWQEPLQDDGTIVVLAID